MFKLKVALLNVISWLLGGGEIRENDMKGSKKDSKS